MLNPINTLQNQRVISIDAFRGITFFIMIIVNELAGINGISAWFKHMPADADAMSFPDIVFPAFLFIVGMSIPFGLNHRICKGETRYQLNLHVLLRALALITMGIFMVNAEGGFHQASMPISIHTWTLLSYIAFALIWGVYQFKNLFINRLLVAIGIITLLVLASVYRGGNDGTGTMSTQWWGILGLIGWAYLISCWVYQICRGKQGLLLLAIAICTLFYVGVHLNPFNTAFQANVLLRLFVSLDAHAAHSSITICGILCSLIFFEVNPQLPQSQRFKRAASFIICLVIAASLLRPEFKISKIYATPSWCFYSAAICIAIFALLYWIIDLKRLQQWANCVKPAAINPLVCYLLPFIIEALLSITHIASPIRAFEGGYGMMAALVYAIVIMLIVHGLNKINFRLKF